MDVLKELDSVSTYKPIKGAVFDLYKLVVKHNIDRKEAIEIFSEKNKRGTFKIVYKKLKDRFLEGILNNSFPNLTKVQQTHFLIWKKFVESKFLLFLDKRIAGVKISKEVIRSAEKNGILEIALSLSRDLELYYATTQPNTNKQSYYAEKANKFGKELYQEILAQRTYASIVICYKKKKPFNHLDETIKKLHKYSVTNFNYRFRLFYHQIKNFKYHILGNEVKIIENTLTAISVFDQIKMPLPYIVKWNFLFQLIPIYLSRQEYGRTENTINFCLKLPTSGSYNWHLTLLYKAFYGFYCNKPSIAQSAYKVAHSIPAKFESETTKERWYLIQAYLAFFGKLGALTDNQSFRLYKFLNTIKANNKENDQRINLIVLELIHLLVDKKRLKFLKKISDIEKVISVHFNKHDNKRSKYFLRLLRCFLTGNYNKLRVMAHAKKHLRKLESCQKETNLNALNREIVPYEILWSHLLGTL